MLNINLQEDKLMNICTGVKLQISEHRMKQLSMITVHKIQEQRVMRYGNSIQYMYNYLHLLYKYMYHNKNKMQ